MKEIVTLVEQAVSGIGLTGSTAIVSTQAMLSCLVIIVAVTVYCLCHKFVMPLMMAVAKKTAVEWDDILLNENTLTAACRVVPAVVVWMMLPRAFYHYPTLEELLARATGVYIAFTSMQLGLAFINSFKGFEGERRSSTQQYFHSLCGVLRIVVVLLAFIAMASIIVDRSPMRLLAGLGATSAVIMLVFKDTITGLVAGIRLTSNNMLHKGDWITVDKAGANGIVEDITLTTVKVRNFDNTIVTVTPQTLVDDSFQNWKGMSESDGRRVKRKVYFDFNSIRPLDDEAKTTLTRRYAIKAEAMKGAAVNMTVYRRYLERWLAQRDDVNDDMTYFVRQLEATDTGLPMEIYFFLKQKEWKTYEHHLAEIMEYAYAIAPDFGLKIYQRV